MRGRCSPEQRAACPLFQKDCFADTHHLAYPAGDYHGVEKQWRELGFNKIQLCRAVHNAIHASGYTPERPFRQEMLQELQIAETPTRALEERTYQLAIGQAVMQGESGYFGDAA